MLLIKNAKLITMEDKDYISGYMTVSDGKILKIGDMADFSENESDFTVIDAENKIVLPGFIDAHCHVGMWEESSGPAGEDGNEISNPIIPYLRAIDAVNPFDEAFINAKKAGVATVVTGPGSANVLGGQFAAMKTAGISADEMTIEPYVAQKAALGENPKSCYSENNQSPKTRMATAALLREALFNATEYVKKWDEYYEDSENTDKPEADFKLECMVPVIKRKKPLKIHAHRADDILTAIRIAEEFNVLITLDHCTEGHLIADILAKKGYPIILGPTLGSKSKIELKNLTFDTYKVLSDKGIDFAIITDHPEIPIEYLPLLAVLAVKNGMKEKDALKAITINAAKNTGISERVGSLKEGKDADFVIWNTSPLSVDATPFAVFIDGKKGLLKKF